MRISPHDKVQAIIRNETYKKEYQKLRWPKKRQASILLDGGLSPRVSNLTPAIDAFCKRWDIPYPINPEEGVSPYYEEYYHSVHGPAIQLVLPLCYREEIKKNRKGEVVHHFSPIPESQLEEGRFLPIRVDLTATKETLVTNFEKVITRFRKLVKPQGRKRETFCLWKVYDARKEGKTYKEIVMLLDPTQDKGSLLSRIDTARKAYEKACRMTKAVDPTPTIGR